MPSQNSPSEAVLREERHEGGVLRLDLRRQVLSVEAHEPWSDPADEPLAPTPPADMCGFVSAATLLFKAKQVDDGLLAAVELAAQQGVGRLPGRGPWLRAVLRRLIEAPAPDPDAVAAVAGAASVGGDPQKLPDSLQSVTERSVERFLANPLQSRPLGFYSWSDPLRAAFRQNRFLQTPLAPGPAAVLAGVVGGEPEVRAAYLALLRLAAGLANPPGGPTLLGVPPAPDRSILPAARSREVALVERLFPASPPPEWFDLMAELVRRVRAGKLSLRPTSDSGWYDHVTWSLAPLLDPGNTPEGGRIRPGRRYRLMLEDLFKGSLALARETHVARLMLGGIKGIDDRVIDVYPALTVEPLPEVYRRRAAAYRFVKGVLDEALGADEVAGLRRLTPDGPTATSLADELAATERLFEGAYRVACREIGHTEEPAPADLHPDDAVACFRAWAAGGTAADPDLGRDGRMMVPVFFDAGRGRVKVWAVLGWERRPLTVEYARYPRVMGWSVESETGRSETITPTVRPSFLGMLREMIWGASPPGPRVVFKGGWYAAAAPVFAEAYVREPMDRDAFRHHCDRHKSRRAILANLS
jgi:hypothetical protein